MKKRDGRSNKISHYPFKVQSWVTPEQYNFIEKQKGLDMASKIRQIIDNQMTTKP